MARQYPFVFIFLLTALVLCSAYYWHIPLNLRADTEADYLDSLRTFRMQVIEQPVRKPNGYMVSVLLPTYGQRALLHLRTDSAAAPPAVGDILLVCTRIIRPHALFDGEFDYGDYLRLQHKVGIAYVQPAHWQVIGHQPVRTLCAYATAVRQRLAQRYADAGLHDRPLALVAAITLGERDALDSDLRQSFAAAGAAHVLAVSGLHTGIIYLVIVSLLTCFGLRRPLYEQRLKRVLLSATVIIAMWTYAFVTGLSPSVMRAVLMLTIVQVGWMCRRQSISVNTLAAAACVCLWAEPLSLFNVSFQLSFSAVLGILLFVPYMNSVWRVHDSRLIRWLRDLVTVSIAAMIGTLPVTLYYFGQVSHYFLLTNIVILPAAYLLVVTGIVTLLLAHTVVGAWLATALQYASDWTCSYVSWIEHLPHATLQLSATPLMVVCLAMAVAFCYLRIKRDRLAWFAPAAAAIALFCVLHVCDARLSLSKQALAIRGNTIYYNQGGTINRYAVGNRCTFFRYDGKDYVYVSHLPEYKQHALEGYCAEHNISIWQ